MRYRSADHAMAKGELLRRMEANLNRLEQPEYDLDYIRGMDSSGWPGDYRGRALLAMTQLSRKPGRKCSRLDALAEDMLEYLSENGYGGDVLCLHAVNEQQLAGHSWLMRSLLAYGRYAGDARFERAAQRLFENLYLPLSDVFGNYPIPDTAPDTGGPAGSMLGTITDRWQLSSDCGCVFIALDGLSDYYAQTGDERVPQVFEALKNRFMEIDPLKASLQTHATLSALRGIMRMYALSRNDSDLKTVTERFELYLTEALTLNYANYNWFGRPRWTECCAVVDSYILCHRLWQETGENRYIEIAERILYNGLMAGQRENGGFGSDGCLIPDGSVSRLITHPECYEAFWCCSMRGAEGLTEAASNSVYFVGHAVHIAGWHAGKYCFGDVCVEINGDFPWEDRGTVTVTGKDAQYELYLYPADCPMDVCRDGVSVIRSSTPFALPVKNNEVINVTFGLSERRVPVGSGKVRWKGPLILDENRMPLSHRMYMPYGLLQEGMLIVKR